MLPDGFYLTRETDNGTSPRHIPFLLVIGRESMHATRHRGEDPEISKTTFQVSWIDVAFSDFKPEHSNSILHSRVSGFNEKESLDTETEVALLRG